MHTHTTRLIDTVRRVANVTDVADRRRTERRSAPVLRLGALLGATIIAGAACSGGDSPNADGELGTVERIVVDETVGADGVTERITVTVGTPASLDVEPVDTDVEVVAPWEVSSTASCVGDEVPQPVAESTRGVVTQQGVHLAVVVARFADDEAAHDAQSGGFCYREIAAATAAQLGRSPGVSDLASQQGLDVDGGVPTEFRISVPPFDESGPTVFSGRRGASLAVVVDLDNGLDEHDGPNLALELAAAG